MWNKTSVLYDTVNKVAEWSKKNFILAFLRAAQKQEQ